MFALASAICEKFEMRSEPPWQIDGCRAQGWTSVRPVRLFLGLIDAYWTGLNNSLGLWTEDCVPDLRDLVMVKARGVPGEAKVDSPAGGLN